MRGLYPNLSKFFSQNHIFYIVLSFSCKNNYVLIFLIFCNLNMLYIFIMVNSSEIFRNVFKKFLIEQIISVFIP